MFRQTAPLVDKPRSSTSASVLATAPRMSTKSNSNTSRCLFGSASEQPHETYVPIYIHTAKCDACNKHNESVVQRCKRCSQQFCEPCVGSGHDDGIHRFTDNVDWGPRFTFKSKRKSRADPSNIIASRQAKPAFTNCQATASQNLSSDSLATFKRKLSAIQADEGDVEDGYGSHHSIEMSFTDDEDCEDDWDPKLPVAKKRKGNPLSRLANPTAHLQNATSPHDDFDNSTPTGLEGKSKDTMVVMDSSSNDEMSAIVDKSKQKSFTKTKVQDNKQQDHNSANTMASVGLPSSSTVSGVKSFTHYRHPLFQKNHKGETSGTRSSQNSTYSPNDTINDTTSSDEVTALLNQSAAAPRNPDGHYTFTHGPKTSSSSASHRKQDPRLGPANSGPCERIPGQSSTSLPRLGRFAPPPRSRTQPARPKHGKPGASPSASSFGEQTAQSMQPSRQDVSEGRAGRNTARDMGARRERELVLAARENAVVAAYVGAGRGDEVKDILDAAIGLMMLFDGDQAPKQQK
jgi:hypothetical protein